MMSVEGLITLEVKGIKIVMNGIDAEITVTEGDKKATVSLDPDDAMILGDFLTAKRSYWLVMR